MRKLKAFTSLVLLATTPTMLVYPQHISPQIAFQEERAKDYTLSYDDMLRFIDDVESGALENKSTPEELEKVKQFVAFLAKQGVLPDDSEESLSLEDDIEDLLSSEANFYRASLQNDYRYMIVPLGLHGHPEIFLCKSWLKKKCEQIEKFAKKHKKALIIGAAVTIAAVAVAAALAAASAAAAAAAASAASACTKESHHSHHKAEKKSPQEITAPASPMTGMQEAPILKSAIDSQISVFKENIVQNQFFSPINPEGQQDLSWQDNGRALGSIFAHDSFNTLQNEIPYFPRLAQEVQDLSAKYKFSIPGRDHDTVSGHQEIDSKFSTGYSHLYSNPSQEADFNTLSHQVRGERALSLGYYTQAVEDLGKAIDANPTNPIPYLERGIAHFSLGQYDRSLEDYQQFTAQDQKPNPLTVSEFSLGFAKGLPKGVYESGEGLFVFMAEFVKSPIQTSKQIVDSISTLVDLVRKDEWGVVAEALSPEAHQLVTEWDTLPSEKKGELAGYAVGKNGADILIPGALVKVASKSVKSAQELAAVCKNLQFAQETLVLETAAGMGSSAQIAEVIQSGQSMAFLGEELGLTKSEIGQLKQAGKLETAVSNTMEDINKNPVTRESYELFDRAEKFLKPYKGFMSETQCRELIYKTGIPTLPRPAGIPENFRVKISDKGAGLIYMHPELTDTSIRIMPGKPHSPHPQQQKPYVVHIQNGKALDKFGNKLSKPQLPEAHIPYGEFVYRGTKC